MEQVLTPPLRDANGDPRTNDGDAGRLLEEEAKFFLNNECFKVRLVLH